MTSHHLSKAVLLVGLVVALMACSRGAAPVTPATPVGDHKPAPPPPGESGGKPVSQPPQPADLPNPSPVTWDFMHSLSALRPPGGPFHLAPPYLFELTFSAPVDRASVEAALARNLGTGTIKIGHWSSDSQLAVAVEGLTPGDGSQVSLDPAGGMDREGRRLQYPQERAHLAAFVFWPAEPAHIMTVDPVTGKTEVLARLPQPFQTVSLSPDGRRLLLRRPVLTPGQSVGITGQAYLFDLQTGIEEELELDHLFYHQWSRDGGLIVWGNCTPTARCVVWAAPGPLGPGRTGQVRRLLYKSPADQSVASATVSPDGRYAAVFAGPYAGAQDLHIFDLSPANAGKLVRTIPKAAGATQGPSGLTSVPSVWAPDSSALAYLGGSDRREDSQAAPAWFLTPASGAPVQLTSSATSPGVWSAKSDALFFSGVGTVDRNGKVIVPGAQDGGRQFTGDSRSAYPIGFSPDGSRQYLSNPDRVRDTATGKIYPVSYSLPGIRELGEYRPMGFTADGRLVLALGSVSDN